MYELKVRTHSDWKLCMFCSFSFEINIGNQTKEFNAESSEDILSSCFAKDNCGDEYDVNDGNVTKNPSVCRPKQTGKSHVIHEFHF